MKPNEDFAAWSPMFEQRLRDCKIVSEDVAILTDVRDGAKLSDYTPVSRARSKYVINWLALRRYCTDTGYIHRTSLDGSYKLYKFDMDTGYYSEVPIRVLENELVEGLVDLAPDIQLPTGIYNQIEVNVLPYLKSTEDLASSVQRKEMAEMYTEGEMIPFSNGIYSVMRNKLLPRTSYVFIEHPLHIAFNPETLSNPIRQRYMDMMCGDETLFELLFEQIGYILYARTFIVPTVTILYGSGSNGKSIVSNVLTSVIGTENRSTLTLSDLTNAFAVSLSEGKLVNIAPDSATPSATALQNGTSNVLEFIKKSTSGEMHQFNPKNARPYDGYGPRKFVFATNVLLNFGGMDGGLARRMYTIPFNASFRNDRRVETSFYEDGAKEWFAMQALVSLLCVLRRRMGDSMFTSTKLDGEYLQCDAAKDMKTEQMTASDTVYHWLYETYEVDIQDKDAVRAALIGSTGLYRDYCMFCNLAGRQPKTINSFHSMLKSIYRIDQRRTTLSNKDHTYKAIGMDE